MKINIITLGCSKNLVDSEYLLQQFAVNGHEVFHDGIEIAADVVILNTCGFILDAKQESIETILHYLEKKASGLVKKVIVMGCLSERYMKELSSEMPEVDGFFGVWDHKEIVNAVDSVYYPEYVNDRLTTTPSHYAFLKISEGCNRACSFCAIPGIRGAQRSRSIEDLADEAENLSGKGAREMILIAQDLTSYGTDLYSNKELPVLLKSLIEIEDIDWIRMHYAYPSGFPLEVIDLMATEPKICKYLDIPIQHINDRILHAMNRGHSRKKLENLLLAFRAKVPNVALRTTILVGYPGETDEEFEELYDFVKEFRFERLGVFPYSHEEKTPAGEEQSDDVPNEVKQERVDRIMQLQQEISLVLNREKIGKEFKVLIDEEEDDFYIGRTEYDSPEVDNSVLIPNKGNLRVGEFCTIRITDAQEFDLFGEIV
jgi:ribosomal protein S12 methylthiotransferase